MNVLIKTWLLWGVACGCLVLSGCSGKDHGVYREDLTTPSGEPAYITIQHCLISFQSMVKDKMILRSKADAEALANELFERAKAGEDFTKIVVAHTDDSAPGIYKLANDGFPGDMSSSIRSKQISPRSRMVPAFGNVGFKLKVGEVGLAPYDETSSRFGWHIIKRLK